MSHPPAPYRVSTFTARVLTAAALLIPFGSTVPALTTATLVILRLPRSATLALASPPAQ